jgi:flagellar hook protein FlgE
MNSISAIALSGLNAASLGMDAAAHNIANAQTRSFRREGTVQEAVAGGGVCASLTQADQPGGLREQDVVDLMAHSYEFKANLLTLRTAGDTLGTLLDTVA